MAKKVTRVGCRPSVFGLVEPKRMIFSCHENPWNTYHLNTNMRIVAMLMYYT